MMVPTLGYFPSYSIGLEAIQWKEMYLFCSNMQGVILNIRKTTRNSGMFVICPPDWDYGIDNW